MTKGNIIVGMRVRLKNKKREWVVVSCLDLDLVELKNSTYKVYVPASELALLPCFHNYYLIASDF